jgi:hypothetical protein
VECQRHRHLGEVKKVEAMELPVDSERFPGEDPVGRSSSTHRVGEGLGEGTIPQEEKVGEGWDSHGAGGEVDSVARTSECPFFWDQQFETEEGGDGLRSHGEYSGPCRSIGPDHSQIAEGIVFGREEREPGIDPR